MAPAEARAHRTAWPWAMAAVPLPLVPLVVAAMAPLAPCAPVEASIPCRQWPWDTPKISKNHILEIWGPVYKTDWKNMDGKHWETTFLNHEILPKVSEKTTWIILVINVL